jgi:hypothetical protein
MLLVALLLSGCGDTINGKALAEPEVTRFHERLNAEEFTAIYAAASNDFKNAITEEKAVALFSAIDRKLGKWIASKQVNWNVSTFNLTTTVVLVYQSTYADGEATETFTFRILEGAPELVGYNISSLDMLIK